MGTLAGHSGASRSAESATTWRPVLITGHLPPFYLTVFLIPSYFLHIFQMRPPFQTLFVSHRANRHPVKSTLPSSAPFSVHRRVNATFSVD